ncbi:PP2C family protein-serine/threonine phosphatase [Pseudooceanicola sp. C21-150M6]|uniref:PP2C family protein-serine/threonine phosphatase n=1 Tax=Pseudooceanicola sp. C21-150M6 TaxID=3434355 RepID=UPI003D7F3A61
MIPADRLRYVARTHVGRVRKVNEDSVIALPDQGIWAVSDGMGGHEGGDYASQTVTGELATIPLGLTPQETVDALRAAIARAHDMVRAEAVQRAATIGATVAALVLTEGHFAAFWAGDSRIYRLRDHMLEMLTTDHSFVATLVEAGRISWDEAEAHPRSNEILRAVGVGEELELDKVRGDLRSGDRFLLCSDGLTKYARAADLHRLADGLRIDDLADRLLEGALESGGADNISIIVVDVL